MAGFNFTTATVRERYNLIIGLVTPRPIALVTSIDGSGQLNAAPFSAFNYACTDPVLVTLGVANRPGEHDREAGHPVAKDTARNIRTTGEFVINVVDETIVEAMNVCAIDFPPEVDELAEAGLTTAPSIEVKVPRIAESPASLECREVTTLEVGRSRLIVGEVVYVHVRDELIDSAGPYVKAEELHSIGRMNGAGNYVRTRGAFFNMPRWTQEEWRKRKGA